MELCITSALQIKGLLLENTIMLFGCFRWLFFEGHKIICSSKNVRISYSENNILSNLP